MRSFKVQTETSITDQDIADIVITAFEGGITYWCSDVIPVERDEHGDWQALEGEYYTQYVVDGVGAYANPEFWDNDKRGYQLHDFEAEEDVKKVLTLSAIMKAMHYQPKQQQGISDNWFKKVVSDIVTENYDAGDADCIVQVAVFGELVYG